MTLSKSKKNKSAEASTAILSPALEASIKSGQERILSILNPKEQFSHNNAIASFLDQLCLQESDYRAKLRSVLAHKSQTKAFENAFFETFLQIKREIYASLSVDEKSSLAESKLSPVVVDSFLDALISPSLDDKQLQQMKYPELVFSALIFTGAVSLYKHPRLLSYLIYMQYAEALSHLFLCIHHVPDAHLAQFLILLNEDGKLRASIEEKFAGNIDEFILNLLSKPKSPIMLKRYFLTMSASSIASLFKIVQGYLVNYETLPNRDCKLQKNALSCPSRESLFDWQSLLIDSQYPLCLLNQDLLDCFSSSLEFTKSELKFSKQLKDVAAMAKYLPSLKKVLKNKNASQSANGKYCVEMANL